MHRSETDQLPLPVVAAEARSAEPTVAAGGPALRAEPGQRSGGSRVLKRILINLDVAGASLAWMLALWLPDGLDRAGMTRLPNTILAVVIAAGLSVAVSACQKLYLARECSVRASETARLGRAALAVGLVLQAGERRLGVDVTFLECFVGVLLMIGFQRALRDGYRGWLNTRRRQGLHNRPIVLVGANEEGLDLYHLIADHPELGYRVCGVLGEPHDVVARDYDVPFLGDLRGPDLGERLVRSVLDAGANGVLMAASALPPAQLNRIVRDFLHAGVHVHLSSGIRGIDHRRVRSHPLAHEPLFYLEPASLSGWQVWVKRCLDVALAGIGMLLAAPVFIACSLAIKLSDRGPVFFRQERVGRDGKPFTILKFRTMVVNAEALLEELADQNLRDGAIAKYENDPRITRVGRLLRATSLDELPQLINVLRGDMSLVGPRPALPSEVEQFNEELLARLQVMPGITGLWQVEARDNASFRAYQRLDIFYVENWSVSLDLAILVATMHSVAGRAMRMLRRSSSDVSMV